jgi:hypothetical protein
VPPDFVRDFLLNSLRRPSRAAPLLSSCRSTLSRRATAPRALSSAPVPSLRAAGPASAHACLHVVVLLSQLSWRTAPARTAHVLLRSFSFSTPLPDPWAPALPCRSIARTCVPALFAPPHGLRRLRAHAPAPPRRSRQPSRVPLQRAPSRTRALRTRACARESASLLCPLARRSCGRRSGPHRAVPACLGSARRAAAAPPACRPRAWAAPCARLRASRAAPARPAHARCRSRAAAPPLAPPEPLRLPCWRPHLRAPTPPARSPACCGSRALPRQPRAAWRSACARPCARPRSPGPAPRLRLPLPEPSPGEGEGGRQGRTSLGETPAKQRRKRGASEKIRQREKGRTEKKKDWNTPMTYAQFRKTAGTFL